MPRLTDEEKKCRHNECNRRWYIKYKDKILAQRKEYHAKNRDKIHTRQAKHYAANRVKIRTQQKEYHAKNQERIIWRGMNARCAEGGHEDYYDRGIRVCWRWHWDNPDGFKNFLKDIGKRPKPDENGMPYSLERMDNDGDYCPENCKWALAVEQQNNKRNTVRVTYKGVEKALAVHCYEQGVSHDRVYERIHKQGFTVEEAFSIPVGMRRSTYYTSATHSRSETTI
jgi:hypothetical protein